MKRSPLPAWSRMLGLALCLAAAGCGSTASVEKAASTDPDAHPLTAAEALETFDTAWQSISDSHFDSNFNGVDWEAIRTEFRPRAEASTTRAELREVVSSMIARLGQSHFELLPSASRSPGAEQGSGATGDLGMDVRILDHEVIVSRVRDGWPAALAGVRPGWRLMEIEDLVLNPLVPEVVAPAVVRGGAHRDSSFEVWLALRHRMVGTVGSVVSVLFEDGEGHLVEFDLERAARAGTPIRFANLPAFYADLGWNEVESSAGGVGHIWFNIWMLPVAKPFDVAIDSLRGAQGVIVDLRGNVGGVGEMVRGFAGHFLAEPVSLGKFRTREVDLEYMARPRRVDTAGRRVSPFEGPLAVLVDEYTGSSSEIFAGGLQDLGRARVFGIRSAGAVLPARTTILPNGDTLLHATADFVTPSGARLEGRGVLPDETIRPTRDDYLSGRDPVLEAAVQWIQREVEGDS